MKGRRAPRILISRVTSFPSGLSISGVPYETELLTKRRAVDYCRVATCLCRLS